MRFGEVAADGADGAEKTGGECAACHKIHLETKLLQELRVMAAHPECLFQTQGPDGVGSGRVGFRKTEVQIIGPYFLLRDDKMFQKRQYKALLAYMPACEQHVDEFVALSIYPIDIFGREVREDPQRIVRNSVVIIASQCEQLLLYPVVTRTAAFQA